MIKIDKINVPDFVKLTFTKWISKFNINNSPNVKEFINRINSNKDIHITFSDDFVCKEYGFLNLDDIKNKVLSLYNFNEESKLLIKQISSLHEFRSKIKYILAKNIPSKNTEYYDLEEKIDDLLVMSKRSIHLTSSFDFDSSTITFYTKNIFTNTGTFATTDEIFELAFIKELHRLYYDYIGAINATSSFVDAHNRKDYYKDLVKESLTAFFVKQYCTTYNIPEALLTAAKNLNPIIYPGSGYLSIVDQNHYNDIFDKSINSTEEALKLMFKNNEELYYKIMNKEKAIQNFTKDLYIKPFDVMHAFEEYFVLKQIPLNIISFYKRTIKTLFKEHFNITVNVLSTLDYNSRLYLVNLLLSKIEQSNIKFKYISATKAFRNFLLTTKNNSKGINII